MSSPSKSLSKPEVTLLLDVSNLAHRAFHAMSQPLGGYGRAAVYGVLRDLHHLARIFWTDRFVFCFDCGVPARKRDFPNYKDRPEAPNRNSIHQQLVELRESILPKLGFQNLLGFDGYEADDLIGCITQSRLNEKFVIVSSDSDLWQLLDGHRVVQWQPTLKCIRDENYLDSEYGLTPIQWRRCKAIMGCDTDGIPGVPKVGIGYARKYIRGELSPDTMAYLRIEKEKELIERNWKLVGVPYYKLKCPITEFKFNPPDKEAWDAVVSKFAPSLVGKYPNP